MPDKVSKTDAEWKAVLAPEQYRITRKKGTEAPFSGEYWDNEEPGRYRCSCCGTLLFDAETKFDAGCGWPSFYAPAAAESVRTAEDNSHLMRRTEVLCASVRRASRPCLRRRSAAHRTTLLHELGIAQVRAEERVTLCACCSPKTMP